MQTYVYSEYKMINFQYCTVVEISKLPASFGVLLISLSRLWEQMKEIGHEKQALYCFREISTLTFFTILSAK